MKILGKFISGLFENGNIDYFDVTEGEKKLSKVETSASDFMNTLSVAKLVKQLRDSAGLSSSTFQKISTLWDFVNSDSRVDSQDGVLSINHLSSDDELKTAFMECYNSILDQFKGNSSEWFDIGHIHGKPMYCQVEEEIVGGDTYYSIYVCNQYEVDNDTPYYDRQLYFVLGPSDNNTFSITMNCNILHTIGNSWKLNNVPFDYDTFVLCYDNNPYDHAGTNFITLDDCEAFSVDVNITNSCFMDVIKQANTDGHIQANQVRSICSTYGSTDGISALLESIAGMGSLQSISVITVIGKIMSQGDSYYDDDNSSSYKVHETPNFITSIVQTIVSLVLSVVSVILSIVFKAIAAVIGLVYNLISTLVNQFRENVANTEAHVTDVSIFPLFNYPLITTKVSLSKLFTQTNPNDVLATLKSTIEEFGCAMLCKTMGKINPYTIWIIPCGPFEAPNYEVMMQVLVSCNSPYAVNDTGWFPDPGQGVSGGPVVVSEGSDEYLTGTYVPANYSNAWFYDHSDPDLTPYCNDNNTYLSRTSDQLSLAAYCNATIFLNDCIAGHHGWVLEATKYKVKLGFEYWHSGQPWPELWSISNYIDNFKAWALSHAPTLDSDGYSANLVSYGFYPLTFILNGKLAYYLTGIYPGWDLVVKLFNMLQSIEDANHYMQLYWANPHTQGSEDADLQTLFGSNHDLYTGMWKWRLLTTVEDGSACSKTAVDFPNLSRNALINALIVTGLGIAAVAVVTTVGKRVAKRVATKNLMMKEKAFEDAKKALENDPTNKDLIKQATKANRKLTKAWKMAGKLGLSTYNGFSTGSASSEMGSSAISSLTSSASGSSSGMENSNIDTLVTLILG